MNAELSLDRIYETFGGCRIHFLEETESTNTTAKSLLRDGTEIPVVVLTKNQTAGRGQHGRPWWSSTESLTFSLVVPNIGAVENGLVPLSVANVVSASIEQICQTLKPKIKWPNDVLIRNRKVAGILVEKLIVNNQVAFIVGIGINVNCSIQKAPMELQTIATSISDELGRFTDINRFTSNLLQELLTHFQNLTRAKILPQFRQRLAFTKGTFLTIEKSNGKKSLVQFSDITDCGKLVVIENGEEKRIASASIVDYTI